MSPVPRRILEEADMTEQQRPSPPAEPHEHGKTRSVTTELARLARDVVEGSNPHDALFRVVVEIARVTGAERSAILVPVGGRALRVLASSDDSTVDDLLVALERYPELREVLEQGEPILIRDVTSSHLLRPVRSLLRHLGSMSLVAVPLRLPDTRAVLRISSSSRTFVPADLSKLRHGALTIERGLREFEQVGDDPSWAELTRAMADAVLEVAADGRIVAVHVNPGTAIGESLVDFEGRAVDELLQEPEPDVIVDLLRGAAGSHRLNIRLPGPRSIPVVAATAPCRKPPLRVRIALRADITSEERSRKREESTGDRSDREARMAATVRQQIVELDRLQRRVEELSARRTLFLSASAHELKTPLTVLQVYLETLLGELADGLSTEQLDFLKICHESVLRLRRLVLDLVDLAALERGEIELAFERVVLQPVLAAVLSEMQPLAAHGGVRLTMDCAGDLPAARADAIRLQQVAGNLLDNAIKHTPPEGSVSLSCRSQGDWLVITVSDTGEGIPAGRLEEIFTEFGRSGAAGVQDVRRSGLGLAVSKRLVSALGGKLTASSQEGQGATFTVHLPVWPEG
jgi:signal transduction histidine kinase